ncbi:MAG: hypothetical protein M1828_006460 [Chrysothrix sp. TS-e1954]|nr:MAG: hypothetical protein M1828_006460 [Chrysothrix sp. TS-e1954]
MAQKCVHKGCGKPFSDPTEECHYHPGPPEFHEGQKGWKCCKPRYLTFDEFLSIPPCTTGLHSTVDDNPLPESKPPPPSAAPVPTVKPISTTTTTNVSTPSAAATTAQSTSASAPPQAAPPPESDSDDPNTPTPPGATCKRRGCDVTSPATSSSECTYHPGVALFHEGTKGWTCCKRRVLEFDEFMRIRGCKTRASHCFVGKRKSARRKSGAGDGDGDGGFEKVETVRHDFYQTGSLVHATYFLKKIDKAASSVEFPEDGRSVLLDLKTGDARRYKATVPLFGRVAPGECAFRVAGTKLDLTLKKAEAGQGWPVLRSDERLTGEIIQTGVAGRA